MRRICSLAMAAALLYGGAQASAQSIAFDFESGGDQGWGNPFAADPGDSVMIPVDSVAGSNRLRVVRDGSFQEVARRSHNLTDAFHLAMAAAAVNESLVTVSYDWYIDTAPGGYGTFLQLGTYYNSSGGFYGQDFPGAGKDVELDGTMLASGAVFSGTISETLSAKLIDMPVGETEYELGLIVNGNGNADRVYFDNIRIDVVPEPATMALAGLAASAVGLIRRRSPRR